jgi:hypothetical protein
MIASPKAALSAPNEWPQQMPATYSRGQAVRACEIKTKICSYTSEVQAQVTQSGPLRLAVMVFRD